MAVLNALMSIHLPHLHAHLEQYEIGPAVYIMDWYAQSSPLFPPFLLIFMIISIVIDILSSLTSYSFRSTLSIYLLVVHHRNIVI